VQDVLYLRGTNEENRRHVFDGAFGSRYTYRDVGTLSAIPRSANPSVRDARGQANISYRSFPEDPHNRTVGQFMGAHVPPAGN
jgi:hypothetical protein